MISRFTSIGIVTILFLCVFSQNVKAQYVMYYISDPITDCEGTIECSHDANGNYYNNFTTEQTICSGNGQCFQLVFTEFSTASSADVLTVYDGFNTFANELGSYWGNSLFDTIRTSGYSNGCITLKFVTDGSLSSTGFKANFSCIPCPAVYALGDGTDTIIGCTADLWDPGLTDFYLDNENVTQTFCPQDSGSCLTLDFMSFSTELNADILSIYDGPTTSFPLIGDYSGTRVPDVITSSVSGGGCLTLTFISNDTIQKLGFSAKLTCGLCREPSIVLGQPDSTNSKCGNAIYDSGFQDSYGNNENYSQTICSDSIGECITLSFPYFHTEAVFDKLKIYEGSSTSGELLAIYSGNQIPAPITSSANSDGCLTLVFTSNNSVVDQGFRAEIRCGLCSEDLSNPSQVCVSAQPFCTEIEGGYTFLGPVNTVNALGDYVGCLFNTDNAVWYYLQIQDSGSIDLLLTSDYDVDFICWGPFSESNWNSSVCDTFFSQIWGATLPESVDCSFSLDNVEHCLIPNAVAGEIYLLMATNYSNNPTLINIQKVEGSGNSNCSYLCDSEINYSVSECDSSNNTYSINGSIYIPHPPFNGNVSIVNSSGGFFTYSSPFSDTLNFSFDQLASDGQLHELQLFFSEASNCNQTISYTAPSSCNACLVSASTLDSIHCFSLPISLMATGIQGAEYSWTGPNGFTSTAQNPLISAADFSMSGTYHVSVFNPLDSCLSSASVNVIVQPYPSEIAISGDLDICFGDTLHLHVDQYSGANYTWIRSGVVISHDTTLFSEYVNSSDQGFYRCVVNLNGCINNSTTEFLQIHALPAIPTIYYDPAYSSLYALNSSGNYQWYFYGNQLIGQQQDSLHVTDQGIYSVSVTNDFNCTVVSSNYNYSFTGINEIAISDLIFQPNPANDLIRVFVPETGMLELFDITGKQLSRLQLQSGLNTLSVEDLAAGLYFIQFKSKSEFHLGKVIIEHN